ncbi:MAG: SpoIIE family protein phosphatase [Bacteroidia bacterium]
MKIVFKLTFFVYLFSFFRPCSYGQAESAQPDSSLKSKSKNINISLNDFASDDEEDRQKTDSVLQAISEIDDLLEFTNPWKIKPGDDSAWAAVDYDDSGWTELKSDSTKNKIQFNGIAWYRMHFEIDSALWNEPLALYLHQFGSAADVYLDGKFLKSFGKVGKDKQSEQAEFSINPKPHAFVFSQQKNHVFAIRYSDFHRNEVLGSGVNLGKNFSISVKRLNNQWSEIADPSQYFPLILLAGIFITLAVVHMVMYIYYRQKNTNLYYSLYCLGFFMIVFYFYYILNSTDFTSITLLSKTIRYVIPLLIIPIVAMLHSIFYNRLLKIFWFLFILYFLSLAGIFFDYDKPAYIVISVLFFISAIEIIRVIIKALRKRKDGAWIFALAILLTPLMGIVSAFLPDELIISGIKWNVNSGLIVLYSFILGLPFSMTLYLARDFARISKKLNLQLKEITELSEKTIRQEKEKKQILENQKSELELKVVERTQEVWQQKEVIEIKNKEITESLIYAKRIQSAILPDIKLIYKALEQSFILYLPKDIVSGDFYGFAQKNNRVIIAAADCTGHGVAGAFMSMIGTALLNQIINEKNISEPAQILNELNDGIIHSLKQKESDSNDGMDISLCSIDLIENELKYAGANRPLWLIRNSELFIYKPNKFPIGGLQVQQEEKFAQHSVSLQPGDAIYLFSDGFADQFGGENGKKMMTNKFKELLLSIQHMKMREQEQHLRNYFEKWKGNYEQVDDVLVIGIRI